MMETKIQLSIRKFSVEFSMVPQISPLSLTPLLYNIISTYFISSYSVLVVYESVTNITDYPLIREYVDALGETIGSATPMPMFQWLQLPSDMCDEEFEDVLLQHVELGVQAYIIVMSDVTRFLTVKYNIQQISQQRNRDHIFLLLCPSEQNMESILMHDSLKLYPNHLIVLPSTKSAHEFNLWTQQFSGTENQTDGIFIDTFNSNSTFDVSRKLYFDKMFNLMGAPLTLATLTYLPYSLTKFVPSGTGNVDAINGTEPRTLFYDGTEARLMLEFCRLRNCTLQLMPFPRDNWGGIVNDTGDGQIGAIFYHEVDIAIGCIYNWYFNVFDTSKSIAKSAITLLVPGALPVSYALTPILPFDPSTWLFLFVTMNVCVILYYAIKWISELLSQQRDNVGSKRRPPFATARSNIKTSLRSTYLEIVAILLQQPCDPRSSRFAVRLVYALFLISGITLENAYTGGLKAMLTIPRFNDKIKTEHEFVQTGYHWAGPQIAWALSFASAQVADDRTMFARFETVPDVERMHNLSLTGRYGIGIERLHANSYSFGEYVRKDSLQFQDILREDLYFEYTMAYAIRGWPLMEYFDKVALGVTEHGLLHHWETETVNKYLDLDIGNMLRQMAALNTNTAKPEILRVAHIYGPLFMLAVGITAAAIAFMGEIIYFKRQLKLAANVVDL